MVAVAMLAVLATGAAAMILSLSTTSNLNARTARASLQAQYLAEGAMEAAEAQFLAAVSAGETLANGTIDIEEHQVEFAVLERPDVGNSVFELRSTAQVGRSRFTSHRLMVVDALPLSLFAVFYANDLEIHPGPNMTLCGRIHTNSDLYISANNSLTLDTNYVHAQRLFRRRKGPGGGQSGGVQIRRWVQDPFDPAEPVEFASLPSQDDMNPAPSVSGYDSDFTLPYDGNGDGDLYDLGDHLPFAAGSLDRWSEPVFYSSGSGSTVRTAANGMEPVTAPDFGSIRMFDPVDGGTGGDYAWSNSSKTYEPVAPGTGTHDIGQYHERAGLVIQVHHNNSWKAYDKDGFEITSSVVGAISTDNLFDGRQAEGTAVKLDTLTIDIAALTSSGYFPDNGLIYAAAFEAGVGKDVQGIVLKNGAELPAPLSVVSENSIYVQGDYNTVDKKPALVMADAVNLLSNAWDNSKTKNSGVPNASATSYNMAIVTGNVPTTASDYSGGFENLIRFHEDWNNVACNISGAWLNLWASTYANSPWGSSGVYSPPIRNWSYDESFNDPSLRPPYMPVGASSVHHVVSW